MTLHKRHNVCYQANG